MQAGYNCLQSQPGTSAMEMQSCLLGLASGQIRLGLTVCNVGNETRRQGDFAFAKNIIITLNTSWQISSGTCAQSVGETSTCREQSPASA